jgi:hypothetical protein
VVMTTFSRSTTAEQLPAVTYIPRGKRNLVSGKVPAAIPIRISARPCPNDKPSSPHDPSGPLVTQVHNQRERILAAFSEAELEEIEA